MNKQINPYLNLTEEELYKKHEDCEKILLCLMKLCIKRYILQKKILLNNYKESNMNKNLVKELFSAFDAVKNQEELERLKQEILNTIEVCYKSNSDKIKNNKFDNKIKKFINDNFCDDHNTLVKSVKDHFKDYMLSDKYIDLMIENRNE